MHDLLPGRCGPLQQTPQTSDTAEQVYRAWKATHPDGTVGAFWRAVDAGEVQL